MLNNKEIMGKIRIYVDDNFGVCNKDIMDKIGITDEDLAKCSSSLEAYNKICNELFTKVINGEIELEDIIKEDFEV